MKKPEKIAVVILTVLVVGGLIWILRSPFSAEEPVGVSVIQSSSVGSNEVMFRITNVESRAILLTDLIVETNSSAGWQAVRHAVPPHPQRLAMTDEKEFTIAAPEDGVAWRLRITYGRDVKGPMLWLGKVQFGISQRAWPGRGFGIMAGSNSCLSEVISE